MEGPQSPRLSECQRECRLSLKGRGLHRSGLSPSGRARARPHTRQSRVSRRGLTESAGQQERCQELTSKASFFFCKEAAFLSVSFSPRVRPPHVSEGALLYLELSRVCQAPSQRHPDARVIQHLGGRPAPPPKEPPVGTQSPIPRRFLPPPCAHCARACTAAAPGSRLSQRGAQCSGAPGTQDLSKVFVSMQSRGLACRCGHQTRMTGTLRAAVT